VAGVLLGVISGLVISVSRSAAYDAEASVLISSPAGTAVVRPQLSNLLELATGGVVAGNVRSTLRLADSTENLRGRLDASVRPESEVIAISAKDDNPDHARQLAQEVAVVFSQLVDARFGKGQPELHAAVLDSAHGVGGPEREYLRNALIGVLVGMTLGASAMLVLSSRMPQGTEWAADGADLRGRETVLAQRIKGVAARELALAHRAGELAVRRRELEEESARLNASERDLKAQAEEVNSSREKVAERERQIAADERDLLHVRAATPPPPADPEPAHPPAVRSRAGGWNIDALQRSVDQDDSAPPELAAEWRTYLYFLREHAAADGSLPTQFDGLIADVFGPLEESR
jgi:capsular polysaccharide biosynthesis protein